MDGSAPENFGGVSIGIVLGALVLLQKGFLNREFPRYQYRHLMWQQAGLKDTTFKIQVEILLQCVTNISFFALPAFVMGFNPEPNLSIWEFIGLGVWITLSFPGDVSVFGVPHGGGANGIFFGAKTARL